ncbi:MAG TPA: DUF4159 domain-containing protein [Gammaproteobacteria bacterium]|jgi:hypothetical protein
MLPGHTHRLSPSRLPLLSALVTLGVAAAGTTPAAGQWRGSYCPGPSDVYGGNDPATPEAEFHMARLMYTDANGRIQGGWRPWWRIDWPEAECHLTRGLKRLTRLDVADDSFHARAIDERLFDFPWLFAQQVGHWYLSPPEADRLREYLLRGGFLVVDDFHGLYEWQYFTESIQRVLPGRAIVDIPESDPLLHILYDLDQRTQIPGRRHLYRASSGEIVAELPGGPPRWRGIYDDAGRLMVAINFNMDMGDAWEHADDPVYPEPMTALAYRFGINYIIYAMTH